MNGEEVKRVACYARVSTQEQALGGYSIGEQKERLTAYCKAKGWIASDFFIDAGFSGGSLNRPEMQRLIDNIQSFDVVLVYKLDRLSRSQRDTLYLIEEIFNRNNVSFVSMNESFDTGTPFGRAMIGILSVFAQLEREQFKERSLMGRYARAKEGKFAGGSKYPLGYSVDSKGKYCIIPDEAEQVRKIYQLYLSGMSVDEIASYMRQNGYKNRYSSYNNPSHITRVLSNPVYIGNLKFREMVLEHAHDAIIPPETFGAVQSIRERRQNQFGKSFKSANTLLAGFLYCAECGSRMISSSTKHRYYYVCSNRRIKRRDGGKKCEGPYFDMDILNAKVDYEIRRLCFDSNYFSEILEKEENKPKKTSLSSRLDYINSQIIDIDRNIKKYMDLYEREEIDTNILSTRINELSERRKSLAEQRENLPKDIGRENNTSEALEIIKNTSNLWKFADLEQKRLLISTLIDRITVFSNSDIKIKWSFQE